MSVLIKGMEMPRKQNGAVLIIYPDGRCAFEDGAEYNAVPVPPHGRLIDADECHKYFYDHLDDLHMEIAEIAIEEMPTIIEADGET